jgi:hypothetical protein
MRLWSLPLWLVMVSRTMFPRTSFGKVLPWCVVCGNETSLSRWPWCRLFPSSVPRGSSARTYALGVHWRSVVLTVLAGCAVPDSGTPQDVLYLDITEPSPVAVGSQTLLSVMTKNCFLFGPCPARPEDVLDYGVDPPGLFDVTRAETQFSVVAVAAGTSSFYVDVSEGAQQRLGYSLIANTIDTVRVRTACASPALMQAGIATAFAYQMWHGSQELNGRIVPLTIVGAELSPPDEQGVPWLKLPAASGTVMITSPYDLSFEHHIDVVDRASIESIALTGPTTPLVVASLSDLRAELLVGTRAVCGGSMPITTTISTPDHCALDPGYGTYSDTIRIAGKAAGDCTVQVTLIGTSLSATKTFPVM